MDLWSYLFSEVQMSYPSQNNIRAIILKIHSNCVYDYNSAETTKGLLGSIRKDLDVSITKTFCDFEIISSFWEPDKLY